MTPQAPPAYSALASSAATPEARAYWAARIAQPLPQPILDPERFAAAVRDLLAGVQWSVERGLPVELHDDCGPGCTACVVESLLPEAP